MLDVEQSLSQRVHSLDGEKGQRKGQFIPILQVKNRQGEIK